MVAGYACLFCTYTAMVSRCCGGHLSKVVEWSGSYRGDADMMQAVAASFHDQPGYHVLVALQCTAIAHHLMWTVH